MRKVQVFGQFSPTGRDHVPTQDTRSGYFLFKSETPDSDHEEELFISHNCVVWSAAGCVKKTFSLDQPVKQAIWASFTPNAPKTDLCILHAGAYCHSFIKDVPSLIITKIKSGKMIHDGETQN
jgi:hypothetical protein